MFGKSILKWIMSVSNIIVVFLLLLVLLGAELSPVKFIFPAYFALAFPIIIFLNIVYVIFWLFARKWMFLLSLSLLLYSASEINDNFPIHYGEIEQPVIDKAIHILSYNTMMSGKLKKHTLKKPNQVMQYVLDSDADIVCLQEFMVSNNDEYLTHNDMLRIFRKYPYKHIEYKLNLKTKRMGIATFSKFPIINKKRIEYTSTANISIYSDIIIDGKTIRLINNHLESNRLTENDKSMPVKLRDNFDAGNLKGITLHFSKKLGIAYKLRANQADAVAKEIKNSPYKVIVCGDFNDVPSSYAYTQVKGKLQDAYSVTGNGLGWTYYRNFFGFRIDYVFYNPHYFSTIEYKTDKVKYSDHYPVLCTLNMKKDS
jgi:endonuclease/exonuclease/phosphatase family metal-dependent hydrolase